MADPRRRSSAELELAALELLLATGAPITLRLGHGWCKVGLGDGPLCDGRTLAEAAARAVEAWGREKIPTGIRNKKEQQEGEGRIDGRDEREAALGSEP